MSMLRPGLTAATLCLVLSACSSSPLEADAATVPQSKVPTAIELVALYDAPVNWSATALAFNPRLNPTGSRLGAIYSSDLGHWDLTDMRDAAYEAWELVEHGLINEDDFRDFVFVNAVRAKTGVNPDFFKGTVVETAVARLIAE